jgi:hypothetical protein
MSEYKKISLEEATKKSPEQYKLSIEYIYSILLPNESVIYVSKAMNHEQYDFGGSHNGYKKDIRYSNTPSLIIITNQRWIRKFTDWAPGDIDSPILFTDTKEKQNFFNSWKRYPRWKEPFDGIPPEDSGIRQGQTPQDWAASDIRFLPLNEISVTDKAYRFSNKNGIKKKYVLLEINDTDYTFEPEDGEKLFSLLQFASINNGQIELTDEAVKNENFENYKLVQYQETFSDIVKSGKIGLSKTAETRRTTSVSVSFLSGSTILRFA